MNQKYDAWPLNKNVGCPQCAEKEAEIAKLKLAESNLVSELAWIKSERPAIAKTERSLREAIEKDIQTILAAITALKVAEDYFYRRQMDDFQIALAIKEALKEIGE